MTEQYYAPKVDSISLPTKGPLGNHNHVQNEVFKASDIADGPLQDELQDPKSRLRGLVKAVDPEKAKKYLHARDAGLNHTDAAEAADDPDYEYEDHDNLDTDDQGKAVHPAADSGSTNPEKVEAELKEKQAQEAADKKAVDDAAKAKADAEAKAKAEAAQKAAAAQAQATAAPTNPAQTAPGQGGN